jgi:hypothetical protein
LRLKSADDRALELFLATSNRIDNKDGKDAKEDREEKDREALARYLEPDRASSDRLAKLLQSTTPGTAKWILQRQEFEECQTNPEISVLWVSGISGAGKSHLAAKMVEQLELMQTQVLAGMVTM